MHDSISWSIVYCLAYSSHIKEKKDANKGKALTPSQAPAWYLQIVAYKVIIAGG
jgi:hypothetical protein